MGKANVTCVSGCTCQPNILNGHTTERSSQLTMHGFFVSQSEKCVIRLTGERSGLWVTAFSVYRLCMASIRCRTRAEGSRHIQQEVRHNSGSHSMCVLSAANRA